MPSWIDYKALREQLDFAQVLTRYGVELKLKGPQHLGYCPLPGHNGSRRSPSFSANMERKIFNCFGCGASGNVLDFAALMENVPPNDGRQLKKVALKLRSEFCPALGDEPGPAPKPQKQSDVKTKSDPPAQLELGTVINEPLDFELKGLDAAHPYLRSRGLTPETINRFGLGFCARGSLAGRVAIPLYDAQGRLIGYAGRVIDDKAITEDNPKYRLPSRREREGAVIEFRKTLFLYNGHRLKPTSEDLIVVEGFPSVWWLTQCGFPRVVATMGADCSDEQIALISSLTNTDAHVWVMPDGDTAGARLWESIAPRLGHERFVRCAELPDGKQPTDLSREVIGLCLLI
jgi:DNA primase